MDEEQDNFYDDEDSYEEPEPTFLKVILRETDDVVLFECASTTIPAESEDAAAVLENNAKYEYLTVGKGRHRPTLDAEVQNPLSPGQRDINFFQLFSDSNHSGADEISGCKYRTN